MAEHGRIKTIVREFLSREGRPSYIQRVTQLHEATAHWQSAQTHTVQMREICATSEALHLAGHLETANLSERVCHARESYSDLVEILQNPKSFEEIIKYRAALRRKAIFNTYAIVCDTSVASSSEGNTTVCWTVPYLCRPYRPRVREPCRLV